MVLAGLVQVKENGEEPTQGPLFEAEMAPETEPLFEVGPQPGAPQAVETERKIKKGFLKPKTRIEEVDLEPDLEVMRTSAQYDESWNLRGTVSGVTYPSREDLHQGDIPELMQQGPTTSFLNPPGYPAGAAKLEELGEEDLRFLTSRENQSRVEIMRKQHELERLELFGRQREPHAFTQEFIRKEEELKEEKEEFLEAIKREIIKIPRDNLSEQRKRKIFQSLDRVEKVQQEARRKAAEEAAKGRATLTGKPPLPRPGLGRREACICDPKVVGEVCICLSQDWKPGNRVTLENGRTYGAFGELRKLENHPRSEPIQYTEEETLRLLGQIDCGSSSEISIGRRLT